MLLSLLSLLGGGLMRLLPELFGFFNKKSDNSHELAMMDKQIEMEKLRGQNRSNELQVSTSAEQVISMLDAQATALKGQMQITGIRIVDGLNFLVRPLATYYVLVLYGLAKVAMFVLAMKTGISGWEAILKLYDEDDRNILSGILGFWFVGRCFDKARR